jgi:phenylalanyl-tRNA synthetase beta chain
MKVLYSQLKELVPGLKAGAKEAGQALSLTGFMLDSFAEVKFKNRPDYLLGFEVRQNRADCLSVYGLAREVAAYYGLKTALPQAKKIAPAGAPLDIKIKANKFIKRIAAIKITGVKNQQSPAWLKECVELQGLNSVNLLVDLSNYVMFLTGYPSHLIDADKLQGNLSWSLNHDFKEITTLFGAVVPLKKDQEIIIRDDKNIIALAGLVGGRAAEIDNQTTALIAEAAIYDRAVIRKNSRNLNIVTEASHRLEKELDPSGALASLELLAALIQEYAGGRAASQIFDYYPDKYVSPEIEFNPESPSRFAGAAIPEAETVKILNGLEMKVEKKPNGRLLVTPPTCRQDLRLPEDLVEEVIRIHGYDKIIAPTAPKLEVTSDITPKQIILAEKARDILTARGFDEILSWPLTKAQDNGLVNYLGWRAVTTQNSINNLYPDLRQSLAAGLLNQFNEYDKKNVELVRLFEIGKIFGLANKKYLEYEALGLLAATPNQTLPEFKNNLEILLRSLGFSGLKYPAAKIKPVLANPDSCWDISANGQTVGIIYKLKPQENKLNVYFAEVNLTLITSLLVKKENSAVVELTQKLIALDANLELAKDESIYKRLESIEKKLDKNHLWSISVADAFALADNKKVKYTIRAIYKELSDQEAKKIHLAAFNLS